MPNKHPGVTAGNARRTGKDQGRINVIYRNKAGETFTGRVVGVGTQLTTPAAPTVTPQGAAGTTAYRYRVSAVDAEGGESLASVGGTTTTGNATLTGTNFNRVTWVANGSAVAYRVYGRSGADSAVRLLAEVTGTTFDDTGALTPDPAGVLPLAVGSDSLRLVLGSGPNKRFVNNVHMATAVHGQSHVYFNR